MKESLDPSFSTSSIINTLAPPLTASTSVAESFYLLQYFSILQSNEWFIDLSFADSNLECGGTGGVEPCGSELWFLSSDTMRPFINGSCQNAAPFSSFSLTACLCPYPASIISPCTCALSPGSPTTTVTIDCQSQGLTDAATVIANIHTWSHVDTMNFNGNQLTAIPAKLAHYNQLVNLKFASANSIASLGASDLSALLSSSSICL